MFISRKTIRISNSYSPPHQQIKSIQPSNNNIRPLSNKYIPSLSHKHIPPLSNKHISSSNRRNTQFNKNNLDQNDLELTQYPLMQYLIGLCLIGLGIYLIYSVSGNKNSIPGFDMNLWWQYIIALIPIIIALLVIIVCESQSIIISRKSNVAIIIKKRCLCMISLIVQRRFDEISGISIVQKGGDSNYLFINQKIQI